MKAIFDKLKHSPIHNYILPGLTSWMLKASTESSGAVRMFESSRQTEDFITPHSHRYGLDCEVLQGWVENTVWKRAQHFGAEKSVDEWMVALLLYQGAPGKYVLENTQATRMQPTCKKYSAGESYSMSYMDIHSIKFSRDAVVVITESAPQTDTTHILLPMAYGRVVPTFKVEPWMYKT